MLIRTRMHFSTVSSVALSGLSSAASWVTSSARRTTVQRSLLYGLLLASLVGLSACVTAIPVENQAAEPSAAVADGRLVDIADVDLPTPEPVIVPDVSARVITEGSRANVRSGPSLDAPIVAKANPGDDFSVVGVSSDGEWWQICCVRGPADDDGEATESAWLATVVVEVDGNADAVPAVAPLFPEELTAQWHVNWECGSERCEVPQCDATITAAATEEGDQQWLEVEHSVEWADDCFDADSWVFEVDRYTGRERSGTFVDNFLYNYWLGVQPGPVTNVYTLDDGRQVAVWCSGPQEFELPESDGWTTVYEGSTCHDVRTGELVTLNYTKRWLYTGSFDGQNYERAYFGDFETLEQYLIDSNAELSFVE